MDIQEHAQIWDAWNAIAAGYDEFVTPTHIWLSNQGLERVGPLSGKRLLDVAAGSGALAIAAVRLGGEIGRVPLD